MNSNWAELPAVMEIIKESCSNALKERNKNFKARQGELFIGRNIPNGESVPNVINNEEFELGTDEKIVYSQETGMIEYIKETSDSFEKREIDFKTGIVMNHEKKDNLSSVEWTRDVKEPKIYCKVVSSDNSQNENVEYDFGEPTELDNNSKIHKNTPVYFINNYSKYEEWFNNRFKNKEEYIKNVYNMQKNSISEICSNNRSNLEESIVSYAKLNNKLDSYYNELHKVFEKNDTGSVYKEFFTKQIEDIIDNNDFSQKDEILNDIKYRLSKPVEKRTLEEVIKCEGAQIVTRIGNNPNYKDAKDIFDNNNEKSLNTIDEQNEIVNKVSKPFQQEIEVLENKKAFMEEQLKVLKLINK